MAIEGEVLRYGDRLERDPPSSNSREQVASNGHRYDETSPRVLDTPSRLPRSGNAHGLIARNLVTRTPTRKEATNGIHDEGEPSLPSTPSQLGLEPAAQKPRGLLFQSPGRKSARKTASNATPSPLKNGVHDANLGARIYIETAPKPIERRDSPDISDQAQSLAHLASRIQSLQQELTAVTLETLWSSDNNTEHKKLRKRHKYVSKDAREILKRRDGGRNLPEFSNRDDKAQSHGIHQRLAPLMPFSGISASTIPIEKSTSPSVKRSFLDRSNLEHVLISQDIEFLDSDGHQLATINVSVNPLSQVVTRQTFSYLAHWATDELRPWLNLPEKGRPLTTIGKTIHQYCKVAALRNQAWSKCREEFPQLVDQEPDLSTLAPSQAGQSIRFLRSSLELNFLWRISVQGDGDVQSAISTRSTLPDTWARYDKNDDLSRMAEIFTSLLGEQGITRAVITLTRILFPS